MPLLRKSIDAGWKLNWAAYRAGWKRTWTDNGALDHPFSASDFDDSGWTDAEVPGDVHLDLMRAGRIPDPFARTNTDAVLWMEQKDWWYRTRFEIPRDWPEGGGISLRLLFHGLDCFASVFLNGKEIGRHANMFTPLELDVADKVKRGNGNVLAVRLASPLFAPLDGESRAPAWWGFPRQMARKAQMSYGWDIAPRLVTIGIWRPVELLCIDRVRIGEPWIRTVSLDVDALTARMQAAIPVEVVSDGKPLTITLESDGVEVGRAELPPSSGLHEAAFEWTTDDARPWWPAGSGDPHLYPYRTRILSGDGDVLDERSGSFGIRTIQLDRSPTPDGGHNFKFTVNGREIFMRGWNWTPPDAVFARITPERRSELLTLAHESGANMLRIWGGGIYEDTDLYRTCDQLGLLVWQDFMFSCSQYPQDDEFLQEVRDEAEHVARSLRPHPCIALWCGDNECDMCYPNLQQAAKNRVNREVLPGVVKRLDPATPYIPSSPDSPAGRVWDDRSDSDAHLWRHGESHLHPSFIDVRPKFVSEIGFLSLPDMEVLRAVFGGDEPTWPPDDAVWRFHSADCIRSQLFRGMKHLLKNIEACGRPAPQSLAECIAVTQELQAEAYRTWISEYAARAECGGILLWNLCDCWPQMSDAVIAWPLSLKKAYYAVKEAFASVGRR